ncbi:unnamed protein product [Absidia cylindrospora]
MSNHSNSGLRRLKSLFRNDNRQQKQRTQKQQHQKQRHLSVISPPCSPKYMADSQQQGQLNVIPLTPPKPPTPPPQRFDRRPLQKLTTDLCQTYGRCNALFRYDPGRNPRRVLTKPGTPYRNSGYDNRNSDFILYVNGGLGENYIVLELLGFGTFGQVAKCRNTSTGDLVAIKVIKNKPAYLKQSSIEVEILKHLNHDWDPEDQHHILRLLDHFTYKHHLCLVFELLSINLYDLVKQNSFKGLSTKLIRSITVQLLDTLVVLNNAKIVHCDLKPENILLKTMESPDIKVVDFGSACQETNQMYSYIQSRFYRSPEVLLGLDYSAAIDMWSLGCIVMELFLGLPIFPGTSEYNQLSRIVDTLGVPPNFMVEQGKYSGRYFNRTKLSNGQTSFKFKSRRHYSIEQNKMEKQSKQYFSTTKLDSLIMDFPWPKKEMSKSSMEHELSKRMQLLDLMKRILCFDPDERLTPQEALLHPFISQHSRRQRSSRERKTTNSAPLTKETPSSSSSPSPPPALAKTGGGTL